MKIFSTCNKGYTWVSNFSMSYALMVSYYILEITDHFEFVEA